MGFPQGPLKLEVKGERWKSGLSAHFPGAWIRRSQVKFLLKPTSRKAWAKCDPTHTVSLDRHSESLLLALSEAWAFFFFFYFITLRFCSLQFKWLYMSDFVNLLTDKCFFRSYQEREHVFFWSSHMQCWTVSRNWSSSICFCAVTCESFSRSLW